MKAAEAEGRAARRERRRGRGEGLVGGLQAAFVGLKLGGALAWSWWRVLAPAWVPALIVLGLIAVIGLIFDLRPAGGARR